ncbi:MAG: thiol reductant ABC exporter subunit CydD, partial [Catenulispora sp.]|nr:thiol reductant ABC exporter subunit CydD [Catenulispora sp.]
MRPVDPRLLRRTRSVRGLLAALAGFGVADAVLLLIQAALLADLVSRLVTASTSGAPCGPGVAGLLAGSAGRALIAWAREACAARTGATVKATLRQDLLRHLVAGPARAADRARTGELATLATRGVDALDGYFARYLPQLVLACVVPVMVGTRILAADPVSAVVIAATVPLIPVFMVLVGLKTRDHMAQRWHALERLGGHFLEVVAGLPTLAAFGRARGQTAAIRRAADAHRRATMRTLRVAFLSSLVLELIAMISVAMVAVGIGLRLANGSMDLRTGLLVLICAPEVYLPLRQVGARYHEAAEGLAAADRILTETERSQSPHGAVIPGPDAEIRFEHVPMAHRRRGGSSAARVSFAVAPGKVTGLVGHSGVGKTTLLHLLLGFDEPAEGRVTVGGVELRETDLDAWRSRIAWLPQRPRLTGDTVAEAVRLGAPQATDAEVAHAADAAGIDFPLNTPIGRDGTALSGGQARRVALARVILRDAPIVLLDEPTEHLDADSELAITQALRSWLPGRTTLLITHRPALLDLCDTVVDLGGVPSPDVMSPDAMSPSMVVDSGPLSAPEQATETESVRGLVAGRKIAGAPSLAAPLPCGAALASRLPTADTGPRAAVRHAQSRSRRVFRALRGCAATSDPPPIRARPKSAVVSGRDAVDRLRLRGSIVAAVALAAAATLCSVGSAAASAWLIATAAQRPPLLTLQVGIAAVQAFGFGRALLRYGERLAGHDATLRLLTDLRVRVYHGLLRRAPAGMAEFRGGDLLAALTADIDAVQDLFLKVLLPAAGVAVAGLALVTFDFFTVPAAVPVLIGGLLLGAVAAPLLSKRTARRAEARTQTVRASLSERIVEMLDALPDVVSFGRAESRLELIARDDDVLARLERRGALGSGLGAALIALASGATTAALAGIAIGAVRAGHAAGPVAAAVVLAPLAFFEALAALPDAARAADRGRAAWLRLHRIAEAPVLTPAPAEPVPVRWTDTSVLEFDGVSAVWPGADRLAVRDLSFRIAAGENVVVTGPSGAGKSTIAALASRGLDPVAGAVRIDGTDLREADPEDVRRIIAVCGQDAHLFDTTIAENLRIGRPDASDTVLWHTLRLVGLDRWAAGLPEGLATPVGQLGDAVSGGERQRIALARALLSPAPVLILDEPTAHLDSQTAAAVQEHLEHELRGRTAVRICHAQQK